MIENKTAYSPGPLPVRLEGAFPGVIEVLVGDFREVSAVLGDFEEPGDWFRDNGRDVRIKLPRQTGTVVTGFGNGATVVYGSGGGITISGGTFTGGVVMRGNRIWVDGREVTEEVQRAQSKLPTLSIDLPSGSELTSELADGSLRISGAGTLARLAGRMGNGDVTCNVRTTAVDLTLGNGNLNLMNLRGDADVRSGNGDVRIDCFTGGRVRVNSGNGDVEVRDRSGSGNGRLEVDARSGNGRVKVPR